MRHALGISIHGPHHLGAMTISHETLVVLAKTAGSAQNAPGRFAARSRKSPSVPDDFDGRQCFWQLYFLYISIVCNSLVESVVVLRACYLTSANSAVANDIQVEVSSKACKI